MADFLRITGENIQAEHICCAFSDKKCAEGYRLKKEWLTTEIETGYEFYRLNERAKVFVEYGPAESAWLPITAPGYLNINCFWVSGRYKGKGYGKQLLDKVEADARKNSRRGLVSVVGKKKNNFMSDGAWLLRQGFSVIDQTKDGFLLIAKPVSDDGELSADVRFNPEARAGGIKNSDGLTVYYSNRCPYTELHVTQSLVAAAKSRNIPCKIVKLETVEQAQASPTPATIFSLFYNGKFVTTDLGVCTASKFEKLWTHTLGQK